MQRASTTCRWSLGARKKTTPTRVQSSHSDAATNNNRRLSCVASDDAAHLLLYRPSRPLRDDVHLNWRIVDIGHCRCSGVDYALVLKTLLCSISSHFSPYRQIRVTVRCAIFKVVVSVSLRMVHLIKNVQHRPQWQEIGDHL